MNKILVIDDDTAINELIKVNLELCGYNVVQAPDGIKGFALCKQELPALVILDVMMPEMNGFELCKKIREHYHYPIIMLTAKGEEIDKITGLTLGADDYIVKPFQPLELVARVKAQLRRYKRYNTGVEKEEDVMIHSGLVMNIKTHECTLNEKPLSLTPTEFSILRILCQQKGNVVSAEELFHQIWGDEYFSKSNNTITVHIRHLREKMGDSFEDPKYIKTIWGCGYKIES